MRVMVLIKADKNTEAGVMPSEELLTAMGKYNEELVNAGIMQAGEGLKPTSQAVRVTFHGKDRNVKKGPFPLNERLICGFWMWKVKSMDEAIDWIKKCPNPTGDISDIELRPIFEAEDFGAEFTPELREQEERLREKIGSKA
jgi:hypothetical protein